MAEALPRPAAEVAAKLRDALAVGGKRAPLFVEGAAGVGKTSILHWIANEVSAHNAPVVRMFPPGGDIDGPANVLAQAAASMREQGVNGVLDPIYDPRAAFEQKLDAFRRGLAELNGTIVVFDVPDSWSRPSYQAGDNSTFALRGHRVIHELLGGQVSPRVVLALTKIPSDLSTRFNVHHVPTAGEGQHFLLNTAWGSCAAAASRLAATMPVEKLNSLTPLALRMLVGLAALGAPDNVLTDDLRAGFAGVWNRLRRYVRARTWLAEAFHILGQMRFPVGTSLKDRLLEPCAEETPNLRAVLNDALLLEDDGRWTLHPRLRVGVKDLGIAPDRARFLSKLANAELAGGWSAIASAASDWRATWRTMVAKWESLHHWAEADEEQRLTDVPDVSTWTVLGRRRSLNGDYAGAVRAFRKAIQLSPTESYAHEYFAYNLDRLGESLREAERAFYQAVEFEPANPWWNRRLIQALLRRGKVGAAWKAWLDALYNVVGNAEPDPWQQDNLHVGVARAFLDSGDAEKAMSVIESVDRERWSAELKVLYNVAQHWSEAQALEASVFPEHIPFEDRWRPRLGADTPRSWYPGRIAASSADNVEIEFAEPPTPGQTPRIFILTLTHAEFRKQAALSVDSSVELDRYLELHVGQGGDRRIWFHPEVSPVSLTDPYDLLKSWRP